MTATSTAAALPPEPMTMRAVLAIIATMRRMWLRADGVSVLGDFLALFAVIGVMTFKLGASARSR